MTSQIKPLDGIRVIEIDSWMAAPSAGAILSDLGAEVIKVEPLGGDPMRSTSRPAKVEGDLEGYDFGFDVDNRGKRSIAIDRGAPDSGEPTLQAALNGLCKRPPVDQFTGGRRTIAFR